jgi:serine/threonine protein kinase
LDYLAPEIVKGLTHDSSIDIWQVGILAYELAVGHPPF